jgi:uncharacterized protein (DUF2235 family)
MGRKLVICRGDTGAHSVTKGDSNVLELFGILDLTDTTKQVAYYHPGVGAFSSSASWGPLARWLSPVSGPVFGYGLRQNLGEVHTWLKREGNTGGRIFRIGFSPGAYSLRALAGMLRTMSLLQHAVSIHEMRRPFRDYLVVRSPQSRLEEVWFAGVHSDVGGTFEEALRFSNVSLKWILDGAVEEGMLVKTGLYAKGALSLSSTPTEPCTRKAGLRRSSSTERDRSRRRFSFNRSSAPNDGSRPHHLGWRYDLRIRPYRVRFVLASCT